MGRPARSRVLRTHRTRPRRAAAAGCSGRQVSQVTAQTQGMWVRLVLQAGCRSSKGSQRVELCESRVPGESGLRRPGRTMRMATGVDESHPALDGYRGQKVCSALTALPPQGPGCRGSGSPYPARRPVSPLPPAMKRPGPQEAIIGTDPGQTQKASTGRSLQDRP